MRGLQGVGDEFSLRMDETALLLLNRDHNAHVKENQARLPRIVRAKGIATINTPGLLFFTHPETHPQKPQSGGREEDTQIKQPTL